MLRRTPIRTKLIVALTLLSAVVLLLAFSGIWGLSRYEKLAKAVSQRARELPRSNALNQWARTLKESNARIEELDNNEHIIALGAESALIEHEESRFEDAIEGFESSLALYEEAVRARSAGAVLLVDDERQRRSLGEIRQSYEDLVDHKGLRIMDPLERKHELRDKLDSLVEQTDDHGVIIHEGMREFGKKVRGQYRTLIAIAWSCTIGAFAILAILIWSFRSLVLKPFRTLLDGSRLVAGGQFDHRIDLGTGDELSELAIAMNEMTDRFQGALAQVNSYCTDLDRQVRQRTREVIQNEQLASVGFLSAGVAHEINNPLASIAWSAESLQSRIAEVSMSPSSERRLDDELSDSLRTNLRRIEDEAYRCKGITEKLLDFSRLSEVQRAPVDVLELVQDVVAMVGKVGKYRCKSIQTHHSGPVIAEINQQEIRQVVLNLVTNALESVDRDGSVQVSVRSDGMFVAVSVSDDGCGMTTDVLQHLFEPFFTRRKDGTGTGLGLSISYRIVSQHGGSLIAKSDGEGQGSEIEMLLPLAPAHDGDDASGRFTPTQLSLGATDSVVTETTTRDSSYEQH